MSSRVIDLYEFGPYRLDVRRRAVTRAERVVPLPPKTFDLLLVLAQSDGRALSKHELMAALWPDTFVEEANLSFQISILRKALGEVASQWIETVPKHGYRFSVDVKAVPSIDDAAKGVVLPRDIRDVPRAEPLRNLRIPKNWLAVSAGVFVLAIGSYAIFRGRSIGAVRNGSLAAVPLTAYPGFETAPSLSPDGSLVAFAWNGPTETNLNIYVKVVGQGEPIALTQNRSRNDNPAFSPDGRLVAFERFTRIGFRSTADLFVVPALGGAAERRVAANLSANAGMGLGPNGSVTWTPDGEWVAHWAEPDQPGIWLFAVDGSERRRRLVGEGAGPAFSPDARRMAYIHAGATGMAVFVLPLTSDLAAAGKAHRITQYLPFIRTVNWTPDGRALVLSVSGQMSVGSRLYRIPLAPNRLDPDGSLELLPFGENGDSFSISRTGRLVYTAYSRDTNLYRAPLTGPDRYKPTQLTSSTYDEYLPDYAPDSQRLAFTSTRTGAEEIWITKADGSGPIQMTSMGGPVCANARWSANGEKILFHSKGPESTRELFVLEVRTQKIERLTDDPAKDFQGSWSHDDKTIYFLSDRTGRDEIWKMRADGGTRTQVTTHGGAMALESPDGRYLYYAKDLGTHHAIWRVPVDGGEETQIVEGLNNPLSFAVATNGLYFAAGGSPADSSIEFFDFTTRTRTTVIKPSKRSFLGLTISPDQKSLVYSVIDTLGRNLMLVDKFQ